MSSHDVKPPWSNFSLKGGPRLHEDLEWINSEELEQNTVLVKIPEELANAKNKIETIGPPYLWDFAKKITNPYELVYTYKKEYIPTSVSIIHPLSRSFYKMIEILKLTDYFNWRQSRLSLRTAHVCEGPGGFIEAIFDAAGRSKLKITSAHAMTLKSIQPHIPGWRRAQNFLNKNRQVRIEYGADGTGDILKAENRQAYINSVLSLGKVNIFTADGGFDFTDNYIAQEASVFPLLCASISVGLSVLDVNGLFVLKIFDYFEDASMELLIYLISCFSRWTIYKPATSRPCNSEQYFIGIGYRGIGTIGSSIKYIEDLIKYGQFPKKIFKNNINELPIYQQIIENRQTLMERQIYYLNLAQVNVQTWLSGPQIDLMPLWIESQKKSLSFCQYFSVYYRPRYEFNVNPVLPDEKDFDGYSIITCAPVEKDGTEEEGTAPLGESQ
jgi:23S rRNA U2552 (ribose-2'-O)-methylase RlmE/FtsJ